MRGFADSHSEISFFRFAMLWVLAAHLILPFPRALGEPPGEPLPSVVPPIAGKTDCAETIAKIPLHKDARIKQLRRTVAKDYPLWKRFLLLPGFKRMRTLLDEQFHRDNLGRDSSDREIQAAWEKVYARAWGEMVTNGRRLTTALTLFTIGFPIFLGTQKLLKSFAPESAHESIAFVLGCVFSPILLAFSAGFMEVIASKARRKTLSFKELTTDLLRLSFHHLDDMFFIVQSTASYQQHGRMHATDLNTNFNAYIFWGEHYLREYLKTGSQMDLEAAIGKFVGALTIFRKNFPDFFEAVLQGKDTTAVDHANRVLRHTLGNHASLDEIDEVRRLILRKVTREDKLGGNDYVAEGYRQMMEILFNGVRETRERQNTATSSYFRSTTERAQEATKQALAPYRVVLKLILEKAASGSPQDLAEYQQLLNEMFETVRTRFVREADAYHELFNYLLEIDPRLVPTGLEGPPDGQREAS